MGETKKTDTPASFILRGLWVFVLAVLALPVVILLMTPIGPYIALVIVAIGAFILFQGPRVYPLIVEILTAKNGIGWKMHWLLIIFGDVFFIVGGIKEYEQDGRTERKG